MIEYAHLGRTEFVVNLTSGPRVEFDEATNTLDNRLLCVKVDITAKKVHLNACIDGEWGREGTVKHKWQQGDEFDIRIRCHEEEFEVGSRPMLRKLPVPKLHKIFAIPLPFMCCIPLRTLAQH